MPPGTNLNSPKRPFYIIAHHCNDLDKINKALGAGANVIECDVRYGSPWSVFSSSDWYVDHDMVRPGSTKLNDWLMRANICAGSYGQKFALIIFDIKTPEHLRELRDRIRKMLPRDLNVLFSTADYDDRIAFDEILSSLQPNEGVAIDYDNDPDKIQSYFADEKNVSNFWYGNGIDVALPGPNVYPSIKDAVNRRDLQQKIKKVYVWTLESPKSITDYINNVLVDGVMVNRTREYNPNGWGISDVVRMVSSSNIVRCAMRNDSAFQIFGSHPRPPVPNAVMKNIQRIHRKLIDSPETEF